MQGLTYGEDHAVRLSSMSQAMLGHRQRHAVNQFRVPLGYEYGSGTIILRREHVQAYLERPPVERFLPLKWTNTAFGVLPYEVTIPAVSILHAHELLAGVRDENTAMVCEVVDVRWWWDRVPARKSYNVVRADGQFYSSTTNGGEPYTWQEVLDDLWSRLPQPQGPFDFSVPDGSSHFPEEPPHNLHFRNQSVWQSICQLLDYLHLVAYYDSDDAAYKIGRVGDFASIEDDGFEDYAAHLQYDSRTLVNDAAYAVDQAIFYGTGRDRYADKPFHVRQETRTYAGKSKLPAFLLDSQYPHVRDTAGEDAEFGAGFTSRQDTGFGCRQRVYAGAIPIFSKLGWTEATFMLTDQGISTGVTVSYRPQFAPPVYSGASELLVNGTSGSEITRGQSFEWRPAGSTELIAGLEVGMMPSGIRIPEGAEATIQCARVDGVWQLVSYDCDAAEEV